MVRTFLCQDCNSKLKTDNSEGSNFCSKCLLGSAKCNHNSAEMTTKSTEKFLRDPRNSYIIFEEDFFEGTIGLDEQLNTDFGHWGHYY